MNILEYIRKRFDVYIVKNNDWVVGELQRNYKIYGRSDSIIERAALVLQLFIKFVVLKRNPLRVRQKRAMKLKYPESADNQQIQEQILIERIKKVDVIIFDLWGVLVCPLLGTRQLFALFETVMGPKETFKYIDLRSVINKEQQKCLEEISRDFCLNNEYMHYIWNRAKLMGKKVFLCNNSAFDDTFAKTIAENFAYAGEIYQGDIHDELYITADSGEKKAIFYKNVNELGKWYRPFYHENVITDFYNRIVNCRFHAGQPEKNIFYEYGFVCGGILTCGFCQYLNELVKQENIEKFLFVSRDGDIIKKIYDKYYKKCDTAYLYYSRAASNELLFEKNQDAEVAAKQYFMQEINGYKNICIVDLGWRGTSAVYLNYLFQKKYKWRGSVIGALIGLALDDVTQIYVRNGMLHAYAFDNEFYRRTGADNGSYMSQEELFCIEGLFSSEEPTLLKYETDVDGKTNFVFASENKNREMTVEIQKGIMDFAKECAPLLEKYHLKILPRDAYTPLDFCMQNRNFRKLISQIYAGEKNTSADFDALRRA